MYKFFKVISPILLVGLMACSDDNEPAPGTPLKNKTVLAYIVGDVNLWYRLEQMLNDMEEGWQDETDGNMIVYLDKSPHLTQFPSPVLLKIRHDETERIVSEVVKYYPEQDSGDPEIMRRVLTETIEMFPAETHGLIIASHGSGWIPGNAQDLIDGKAENHGDKTRAISGPDRYGSALEIDEIARQLPVKYEFILFHACMMGNVETAYALKDKCDFMVGCSTTLPGINLPFDVAMPFLFTAPRADWYRFLNSCFDYYDELPDDEYMPLTLSVVQTDRLEMLAAQTRKVMTRLAADPEAFYANLRDKAYSYSNDPFFSDLRQVIELQCDDPQNPSAEITDFFKALEQAVPLKGFSERWEEDMLLSPEAFCGLSCYVPHQNIPMLDKLQEYYRKHYKWAEASGFDLLIK